MNKEEQEFHDLVAIAAEASNVPQDALNFLLQEQKIINNDQFYIVMMSCIQKPGGTKNGRNGSNLLTHHNPMLMWYNSIKKKKSWVEPVMIIGPFDNATNNPIVRLNEARVHISRIKGVPSKVMRLIPFVKKHGVQFIPCQPTTIRREEQHRLFVELRKAYPTAELFSGGEPTEDKAS